MSAQPIQAGVSAVRPFGAIVAESGDKWAGLPTPQKLEVLDGYLENRAQKDPAFGALDEKQRFDVKTGFISKFILNQSDSVIGQQQPQNQPGNIGDFAQGLLPGLATSGAYITQPFEQLFTGNTQRYDVAKTPQYQQNSAYRMGADVGNTAGNLAQYAVGALGGIPGIAAVSANQNIQRTAAGEQNAGQAVYNTGLDTILGGLAPQAKSLLGAALKNAGIGAIGGAAGYAGNQAITGQPFNVQDLINSAKQAALEGGAIGAGFHFAHPYQQPQTPPRMLQGRVVRQEVPAQRFSAGQTPRAQAEYQKRISNEATAFIQLRDKGMTQQSNAIMGQLRPETQARVKAEVKAFDERNAARQTVKNEQIKAAVQKLGPDASRQQQTRQLREAIQGRAAKERNQYETDFKALVAQEKELTRQHKEAVTRQKILDKRVQNTQNLKQKQAIRDRIALEKAEGQKRAAELRRMRQDIQSRASEQRQPEASTQKQKPDKTESAGLRQSHTSNIEQARATLEQAIQQGKAVVMEHRAEKAGTRDESTFRQKQDLPYEFGSNEKGEFVRVINENGQVSMRYLHDLHGEVRLSDERHPYTFDQEGVYKAGKKKGESGRFRVLDEDGNEVSQVKTNLTKDRELAGRIQKMEEIVSKAKSGKKPTAREILDASKGLDKESFKKAMEGLPADKVDEIAKDIGC